MAEHTETKVVKRLNTTLPDPLAVYVGQITGKGTLYETSSEFIRDLIRRHMEHAHAEERKEIRSMLAQSLMENDYAEWTTDDLVEARKATGS